MGWGINLYDLVRIKVKHPCSGYYLRWYYNGWHYWFFLPGNHVIVTEGEKYRTIGTRKIAMSSGQITREQTDAIRTIMFTREVYLLTTYGWMNIRIEPGTLTVYDSKLSGVEVEFVAIIGSKELSYATGYTPVPGDPGIPVIPIVPPDIVYCEIAIGTQIWMCKNWDSNYPGSKVYNDDEANRSIYGGLYTWDMVFSNGFCPIGWHIPTITEWSTLINFLGGAAVTGGHLKEIGTTHWDTPNTGADNTSHFTALGSGYFYSYYFQGLGLTANFWAGPAYGGGTYIRLNNSDATVLQSYINQAAFLSVRLIKDTPAIPFSDWWLPAIDDLDAIYNNLFLFGIGGFDLHEYWSSTEVGFGLAKTLDFNTNIKYNSTKTNYIAYHTRACRSFTAPIGAYSLRDVGPAGGWIYYISGTIYYEAAQSDQLYDSSYSNIMATIGAAAQGTAIGTGQANTLAIIGQGGFIDGAAKTCNDLIIYH